jgi:hypothetical protein
MMQFLRKFRFGKKAPDKHGASHDGTAAHQSSNPNDYNFAGTGTSTLSSTSRASWSPTRLSLSSDSLADDGLRDDQQDGLRDMRADVMVNWLHGGQEERIWTTGAPGEGVILKVAKGQYVCCPSDLQNDSSSLFDMISQLNVRVSLLCEYRPDVTC